MKRELIVPIRDRRQHRRVLTIMNFARVALVALIVFLALTIQSDLRHSSSESFGRLFGKQVSGHPVVAKRKFDVIREAPVDDQTSADPLLVAPAARSQYLGAETPMNPPAQQTAVDANGNPAPIVIHRGAEVEPSRPLLSGGIFRH